MNHETLEGEGGLHAVAELSADAPSELESHIARREFAEACGRRSLNRDPDLFERSLLGRWESMEAFVESFIDESGLREALVDNISAQLRPFVAIDPARVAANLRQELLVVPVGERVWVFDAPRVVNSTVRKTEQWAHNEKHDA